MQVFKLLPATPVNDYSFVKMSKDFIKSSENGRAKSRCKSSVKPKKVTLEVPTVCINKTQAEQFGDKIEGKSRFFVNETMIKINQHTTKCIFDDFSYIMFKADDFTVYNKFGQVVSYGKHLNKDVLNAKGKK